MALVGLIIVWNWAVQSGRVNRIVLPEPASVLESLQRLMVGQNFWRHFQVTVGEIAIGFVAGALAAVGVAVVGTILPMVRRVLSPYIVVLQAVPKIVLLPLIAVWIDVGFVSTAIIVALVTFFPVYVNADLGLRSADESGVKLLRSLNASRADIIIKYRLPSALPLIFTGGKIAVNYAILAGITSEFLGSREGLGYLIITTSSRLQLGDLYAAIVVTAIVAGGIYAAFELLDRRVVFWRER